MDEQDIQDCLGESRVLQFRASKRIFNIDAQDIQDLVLGVCSALILGICNPASDNLVGQHPVQQPFILFILFILCIDVKKSTDSRCHPVLPNASAFSWLLGFLRLPLQAGLIIDVRLAHSGVPAASHC